MGALPNGRYSDLSEWPRWTDAKERRRRRQMSGTATGHLLPPLVPTPPHITP